MQRLQGPSKICPECGATFTPTHHLQTFCTREHQKAFHQLSAQRGKVLLPLALVMRDIKRGKTEARTFANRETNALLDKWNREDKAAGRRSDLVVKQKQEAGWKAADLL